MSIIWKVREIVDQEYKRLGIPHFQRGLVWNKDAVARLLESLFYDTPCGTLILWKPKNPEREGIPLPGLRKVEVEYLIVDGQQRIRSLHDALCGLSTEAADPESGEEPDDTDGAARPTWCLNLTRIPDLAPLLKDDLIDFPLFMKVSDPRVVDDEYARRRPTRFRYNLIPLSVLMEGENPADLRPLIKGLKPVEEVLQKIRDGQLGDRVRAIRERIFPVLIREEREGESGLGEVVDMYNRINSGGVRVEAEERAFATLVSLRQDEVEAWLRDLFREVHGGEGESSDTALERDDVLRRTKERNFGFKLFIRTFIQVCNYQLQQRLGSSAMSFDALGKPSTLRQLKGPEHAQDFTRLLKDSKDLLTFASRMVRDDLGCDNFAFLPDASSFAPMFQLVLKYPSLGENGRRYPQLVKLFLLKTLLADLSQRDILKLVDGVRKTNKLEECREIVRSIPVPDLAGKLYGANSLQNRYVLLLYWLLRRRGARDFDYSNLPKGTPPDLKSQTNGTRGVPVESKFHPEKQHIIPYSYLEGVYEIDKGSRLSTHPANNIGNLTFISHAENECFEGGLGQRPIDWAKDEPENLRSHFLIGDRESLAEAEMCRLYLAVLNPAEKDRRTKFETFCRKRAKMIADAFVAWLKDLEDAVPEIERMEPTAPAFAPTLQDKIRRLNYDNDVEDELLALSRKGAMPTERKDGRICLGFLQPFGRAKRQVLQLQLGPENLVIKFPVRDAKICRVALEAVGATVPLDDKQVEMPVRGAQKSPTVGVLKAIIGSLSS